MSQIWQFKNTTHVQESKFGYLRRKINFSIFQKKSITIKGIVSKFYIISFDNGGEEFLCERCTYTIIIFWGFIIINML